MRKKVIVVIILILVVLLLLLIVSYPTKPKNEISKSLIKDRQTNDISREPITIQSKKISRKTPRQISNEIPKEILIETAATEKANASVETDLPKLYVKEFGETIGEAFSAGFVFFDGKYIDAPYTVTRKGLGIFVNDIMVEKSRVSQWPMPDPTIKEDPGFFPEMSSLSRDTSLKEFDELNKKLDWHSHRKSHYLLQHFSGDIAVKKMAEYYLALPFVRNVEILQGSIRVETLKGEKRRIAVRVMTPGSVSYWMSTKAPTKEEVSDEMEYIRSRFDKRLKAGDCFFLFTKKVELSFAQGWVNNNLPKVVEMLKSSKSEEEKSDNLKDLDIIPNYWSQTDTAFFVTNFQSTPQLDERIKEIKAGRTAPPEKRLSSEDELNLNKLMFDKTQELGRELTKEEQSNLQQEYFRQKEEKKRQRDEERKKKQ